MSSILPTLNQGDIETGFEFGLMSVVNFGEYRFSTHGLCKSLNDIAINPILREGVIRLIDSQVYRLMRYDLDGERLITAALASGMPEGEAQRYFDQHCKGIIDEHHNLAQDNDSNGIPISYRITEETKTIDIGIYQLEFLHFRNFAFYVLRGGITRRWPGGEPPNFAKSTLEAVVISKNPLFQEV